MGPLERGSGEERQPSPFIWPEEELAKGIEKE